MNLIIYLTGHQRSLQDFYLQMWDLCNLFKSQDKNEIEPIKI